MRMNRNRVVGLTAIVLGILIISMLVVSYEFPILNSAEPVKKETTEFLWTYRLVDLIAQAFVLFAAAACCVAILRVGEKNDSA